MTKHLNWNYKNLITFLKYCEIIFAKFILMQPGIPILSKPNEKKIFYHL